MKNKIVIGLLAILFFVSSISFASAEIYYHKGIVYGTTPSTKSSAVVLAASAMNADGVKKEHVAIYSRCDVLEGAYNAQYCFPRTVVSTLYASSAGGTIATSYSNAVTQIAPGETSYSSPLANFAPYIKNYWYSAAYITILAYFNNAATASSVKHERDINKNSGVVTYNYPSKSILDVPNSVAYTDILGVYDRRAKGLSTNYVLEMVSGYLTAKAKITYEMGRDTPSYDIYLFNVTSETSLTDSIGM